MSWSSGIYRGDVVHRRFLPRSHSFRSKLFLMYLDLAELPELFRKRWLWSVNHWNLACWRRSDYLGPADVPLDQAVRDRVEEETGVRPRGPIRMLTHLRYLGYVFNPVSFYYCFDEDGTRVDAVVAEITNTPWKERHSYVLHRGSRPSAADGRAHRFAKEFHVSPFFDMDLEYLWTFATPADRITVHMENLDQSERAFDVVLRLERSEINGRSLAAALLRYPAMTLRVHAAIYWQAFRLWLKRMPFYPHPAKRPEAASASTP